MRFRHKEFQQCLYKVNEKKLWFQNGLAETDDPDFITAFRNNPAIEVLDENEESEQEEKKSTKRNKGGSKA